jgi:hypothetical protein
LHRGHPVSILITGIGRQNLLPQESR